MHDTETQQIILEILEQAQSGKSFEFRFITSWSEFQFFWQSAKATKLLIRTLKASAKDLFNTYCEDVADGAPDVNKLLAVKELEDVIAFYAKDLATLERMLDDYDKYLGQGNFWHAFLGGERKYYFKEDEDIWNIR